MGWLVAFSVIATFLCFRYLFGAMDCLRRGRFVRAGGSGVGCIVSAALAGAGVMLLLSYMSYGRLTAEQQVARIEFRQLSADEFQARLMIDREQDRLFLLRGDEWQMDARIVTWKPPMTILGLEPIYRLDRLSGRYAEIDREQSESRTVHSLAPELPADLWRFARRFPVLAPGVDAHYGTATFVPMADGARFDVSLSRDALIARPDNDRAREAVGAWRVPGE
jgi:hypothetical protein